MSYTAVFSYDGHAGCAGIADAQGHIAASEYFYFAASPEKGSVSALPSEFFARTENVMRRLCERSGIADFSAASFVLPARISREGLVTRTPLTGWEGDDIRRALEKMFPSAALYITDIASASARAQARFSSARQFESFLWLTLDNHVSGAVYSDGAVIQTDIGHLTVEPAKGALCRCGRHGCLDAYASVHAVNERMQRMSEMGFLPELTRYLRAKDLPLTASSADLATRDGSGEGLALFTDAGRSIARAVSAADRLLSIQAVFFGGELAASLDLMYAAFAEELAARDDHEMKLLAGTIGSPMPLRAAALCF